MQPDSMTHIRAARNKICQRDLFTKLIHGLFKLQVFLSLWPFIFTLHELPFGQITPIRSMLK